MNPPLTLRLQSIRSQLGLIPSNKGHDSVNFAEKDRESVIFQCTFHPTHGDRCTIQPVTVIYPPVNCLKNSTALDSSGKKFLPSQYQFYQIRLSSKALLSVMVSSCTLGSILQYTSCPNKSEDEKMVGSILVILHVTP